MKKRAMFSLFSLILLVTLVFSMEVSSMNTEAGSLEQLNENKRFIIETFEAINENPGVSLSSTIETAKVAEPELYDSMLSRGEELLPAVLSLMEESDRGRRTTELYMLYMDIQEIMGKAKLAYDDLVPLLPENPPNDPEAEPSYVWWTEVDPSVNIPEPDNMDDPLPDYLRWEPMLGGYIYADAYYIPESGMIVLEEYPELPPEPIFITISVRPDDGGIASANSDEADIGDIITVRHEAATGYRFKEWNVLRPSEGLVITNGIFEAPYEDVEIEAVFYLVGDVDGDGMVTMADAMLIFDYLSGTCTLSPEQMMAADVDGDTIVSMADFMRIFDYLSGLRPLP